MNWLMINVRKRAWRWGAIALLSICFAVLLAAPGFSQVTIPGLNQTTVSPPPPGVRRIGELETTEVRFDGRVLFTIAAPTVRDRNDPGDRVPVELRAELIQSNLRRILNSAIENRRGSPEVVNIGVARLNNELVISGRLGRSERTTRILTITEADSDYHQLPADTLAANWRSILQTQMNQAIKERTYTALMVQLQTAAWIALKVLAASTLMFLLQVLLAQQRRTIQRQLASIAATTQPNEPERPLPLLPNLGAEFFLKQRLKLIRLVRYLLLWGQIALWLYALALILALFPATRGWSSQVYGLPILWMAVWFGTGLLNQLADLAFDRLRIFWEQNNLVKFSDAQRTTLRIGTTIEVLRSLKTVLIYLTRIVVILSSLGVPISSILAVGGFLALAISLGSQNLVKDIINGLLIVWEDQYAIGDVVQIEPYAGMVENLNLRVTQLRNAEGCLITIPNSTITKVANLTRTWSRVNLEVWVDITTAPDPMLSLLAALSQEFYEEPAWHSKLLAPPEVLGIDEITASGLLVRIWIKTQPGQQWAVAREFRRRMLNVLAANGIPIGRLHQQLHLVREVNGHGGSPDASALES